MSNIDLSTDNPVISVSAEIGNVSAVTEFVETTAGGMGLGTRETMALTLASEEIFAYLCMASSLERDISVSCLNGCYYVRLDFLFDDSDLDIGAFNLTSKVSPDDEASLDEMGLLIAARSVDRFCFRQQAGELSRLTLICDKKYEPASEVDTGEQLPNAGVATVVSPEGAGIEYFAGQVWGLTQPVPGFFEFPAKVSDMVLSGEFAVAVAERSGKACGGIVWTKSESKTVECFGPYMFGDKEDPELATQLLDFCLADIARTPAVGLLNRFPAALPYGYFESLGERQVSTGDGSRSTVRVSFRQTKDDPGCTIRTDSGIEAFLLDKYREMAFPREVVTEWNRPMVRALRSVLSTDLDRQTAQATLRPVLAGDDCEQNIAEHLKLLQDEKVEDITFEMDLGDETQVSFVPALLANGFRPTVLLPYAGRSDIVIFEFDRA